jgi:DNA polymerase
MSQEIAFNQLAAEAARCTRCERMCVRRAVLSHLNGPLDARVMFIAEAPGRQGADRTRIPFGGDASGVNFDALIASIQLTRDQVFITNSVLCNPRTASGANDRPTREETRNCSDFLHRQIELINPRVIATLGAVALDALRLIEPHPFRLGDVVGKILRWSGRLLVPLYHPSPRVTNAARPMALQMRDYRVLRRAIRLAER